MAAHPMLRFEYAALPGRVVFGAGSLERLPDEVARLGAARALVVSTPGHRAFAEDAAARLGGRAAGIWDRAKMHAPIDNVEAGRAEARRLRADACVAIGGGTPIGLAKAIALELAVPVVAVPTTYAGSEMTPVLGITEGGIKRTRRDPKMLPQTVIYDPLLTFTLPPAVSGPSGMNAIAHCVEALYAPDGNPLTALLAEEGIRALAASLPVVVRAPEHAEARAEALYGAWLAGTALASTSMALHHKLCHTLGGTFDLPHAEVHTIILPHATAYNRKGAPAAMARIARALDAEDAATGLFDLAAALGTKQSLAEIGLRAEDLDRAADLALESPYPNPTPITRAGLRALLDDAFHGRRPVVSRA
jgi:alcohol dehydrogenase class IV